MGKAVIGKNIISGEEVFFSSAAEAEKAGFNRFSISRCCNGKGETHNGYLWQFFDGNSCWGKIERSKRINVLRFIKDFVDERGFSPSVRDIAKGMNISASAAHYHLKRLESDGYIKTSKSISRSIVLTEKAHEE